MHARSNPQRSCLPTEAGSVPNEVSTFGQFHKYPVCVRLVSKGSGMC